MTQPPTQPLLIKNARVIDPAAQRDAIGDLFVNDGIIVEQLTPAQRAAAHVIDASGLVAAPGFVDLQARLGEPGNKARETIKSIDRAAAAGGFTTIVAMPDTTPPVDNPGTVQLIRELARDAKVTIHLAGAVTIGLAGEKLAPIGSLHAAGVVAITDALNGLKNNEIMRRALEYSTMFKDLVIFDHCQDSSMTSGALMHEGACSLRLGLRGFPAAAEEIVVASDILLARLTGARLHLQHITSANSVSLIRMAKNQRLTVTAEVAADHLFLTDTALENYDTNFKLAAPLREESDRQALLAGLRDGTLDAIVSDHTPVTPTEKDREFDSAPFGAIGLETAFSVALMALLGDPASRQDPLPLLVDKLTRSPARILNLQAGTLLPGRRADITLFAPEEMWTPSAQNLRSLSRNSPHLGRPLRGRIRCTIINGAIAHDIRKPQHA